MSAGGGTIHNEAVIIATASDVLKIGNRVIALRRRGHSGSVIPAAAPNRVDCRCNGLTARPIVTNAIGSARAGIYRITPRFTINDVITIAASNTVVTIAAINYVIAIIAQDRIISI